MGRRNRNRHTGFSIRRILLTVYIMLFAVLYLWVVVPALQFMGNSLPQTDTEGESHAGSGDVVLDMGELLPKETEAPVTELPETSENPESPQPTEDGFVDAPTQKPSSSGGGSSLPYVPDPIVDGVTKANGSGVKLEPDARNILVLGVDEASVLTDSMMIISICDRTGVVQVLSLARDAYVPYSQTIKNVISKNGLSNSRGIYKLNATMNIGNMIKYSGGKFGNSGIDFLCHVMAELLPHANIDIDDYVYIDESAFIEVVNMFGGVDVHFNEDWYSASGDEVGVILYEKGYHHLNGREALNYVKRRGRFSSQGQISSSGDPYRKANQLGFMRDFAEQVVTLDNVGKIPQLLETASKYVFHSLNSVNRIAEYTDFATRYAKDGYELKMTVVTGTSIDPLGDGASYVNLMG